MRTRIISRNSKSKNSTHESLAKPIQPALTLSSFLTQSRDLIWAKSVASVAKIYDKLNASPSVISFAIRDPIREQKSMMKALAEKKNKDKLENMNNKALSPATSRVSPPNSQVGTTSLTQQQQARIKEIAKRRLQLMDRLRKIDSKLIAKNQEQTDLSRFKAMTELTSSQAYLSLERKASKEPAEESSNHIKAMEMLARINKEKITRQKKIVNQMQKKQSSKIYQLAEIDRKSEQDSRRFNSMAQTEQTRNNIQPSTHYEQSMLSHANVYPENEFGEEQAQGEAIDQNADQGPDQREEVEEEFQDEN